MKPSNNVRGATTKVPSKRDEKKQINISWNSRIFFQVGLLVSLLAMIFVMELKIGVLPNPDVARSVEIWDDPTLINYTVEKEVVVVKDVPKKTPERRAIQPTTLVSHTFKKVDDNTPVLEGKIASAETPMVSEPTSPSSTAIAVPDPTPATVSLLGVEHVPVYPGCEGALGNQAKIDCMSSKIKAFVGRKFDTGKFDYFDSGSVQRIHTVFTIAANGAIVDVRAKAIDKKLEAEAMRVIEKLPLMQPGKQGATPVNVTYSVPIHFKVNQ